LLKKDLARERLTSMKLTSAWHPLTKASGRAVGKSSLGPRRGSLD
jgi:hypothetical protein